MYFVSVKTTPEKYENFEVPYAVYVYIKQLEYCVTNPHDSLLKKLYPDRLGSVAER